MTKFKRYERQDAGIGQVHPKFCMFCREKTKIERGGRLFCPNGHYEVKSDGEIIELQPITEATNLIGEKIYCHYEYGWRCNEKGERKYEK